MTQYSNLQVGAIVLFPLVSIVVIGCTVMYYLKWKAVLATNAGLTLVSERMSMSQYKTTTSDQRARALSFARRRGSASDFTFALPRAPPVPPRGFMKMTEPAIVGRASLNQRAGSPFATQSQNSTSMSPRPSPLNQFGRGADHDGNHERVRMEATGLDAVEALDNGDGGSVNVLNHAASDEFTEDGVQKNIHFSEEDIASTRLNSSSPAIDLPRRPSTIVQGTRVAKASEVRRFSETSQRHHHPSENRDSVTSDDMYYGEIVQAGALKFSDKIAYEASQVEAEEKEEEGNSQLRNGYDEPYSPEAYRDSLDSFTITMPAGQSLKPPSPKTPRVSDIAKVPKPGDRDSFLEESARNSTGTINMVRYAPPSTQPSALQLEMAYENAQRNAPLALLSARSGTGASMLSHTTSFRRRTQGPAAFWPASRDQVPKSSAEKAEQHRKMRNHKATQEMHRKNRELQRRAEERLRERNSIYRPFKHTKQRASLPYEELNGIISSYKHKPSHRSAKRTDSQRFSRFLALQAQTEYESQQQPAPRHLSNLSVPTSEAFSSRTLSGNSVDKGLRNFAPTDMTVAPPYPAIDSPSLNGSSLGSHQSEKNYDANQLEAAYQRFTIHQALYPLASMELHRVSAAAFPETPESWKLDRLSKLPKFLESRESSSVKIGSRSTLAVSTSSNKSLQVNSGLKDSQLYQSSHRSTSPRWS